MKQVVIALALILVAIMAFKRKPRNASSPANDDWKRNRNRKTKRYNSAGYEINPRRNVKVIDRKSGRIITVDNPYKD